LPILWNILYSTSSSKWRNEKEIVIIIHQENTVAVCIRDDDCGVYNAYNIYKAIIEPLDNADVCIVVHYNADNSNSNNNNSNNCVYNNSS
jgi:hypothetical protein